MSDRFIDMLILHQRIETALEITFVAALLAALVLVVLSNCASRLRAPEKVLLAGLLAFGMAIACFIALPRVRRAHWEERDWVLAEDRRAYEIQLTGSEMNGSESSEEQSSSETETSGSQLQTGALRSSRAAGR